MLPARSSAPVATTPFGAVPPDVDRARRFAVVAIVALAVQRPMALAVAAADAGAWLVAPGIAWWLSKPPAPVAFAPTASELRFLRVAGAQDMGLLRGARRAAGTLVAAGQHPGKAVADDCPPHLADQHRAGAAGQSGGLRFRLCDRGTAARAHQSGARDDAADWSAIAGHFYNWYDTLTLQPLAAALHLRRSTAATSPAIC